MTEAQYQRKLTKTIQDLFPGAVVLKNDPRMRQGVPDILVLYRDHWAMLEIKLSGVANIQPNQEHYIRRFHEMSFASFINPETEEEVLDDLQHAFGLAGATRIS
jgi:hypothetical protein